jgi:hypothetical protein
MVEGFPGLQTFVLCRMSRILQVYFDALNAASLKILSTSFQTETPGPETGMKFLEQLYKEHIRTREGSSVYIPKDFLQFFGGVPILNSPAKVSASDAVSTHGASGVTNAAGVASGSTNRTPFSSPPAAFATGANGATNTAAIANGATDSTTKPFASAFTTGFNGGTNAGGVGGDVRTGPFAATNAAGVGGDVRTGPFAGAFSSFSAATGASGTTNPTGFGANPPFASSSAFATGASGASTAETTANPFAAASSSSTPAIEVPTTPATGESTFPPSSYKTPSNEEDELAIEYMKNMRIVAENAKSALKVSEKANDKCMEVGNKCMEVSKECMDLSNKVFEECKSTWDMMRYVIFIRPSFFWSTDSQLMYLYLFFSYIRSPHKAKKKFGTPPRGQVTGGQATSQEDRKPAAKQSAGEASGSGGFSLEDEDDL